jgi:hypothetical protein
VTAANSSLPSGASVLRRSLVVWGLGHLAIGDRRGWLMLLAQPLAIAGLLVFAALLIEGTRWMVVFPALLFLLVAWLGQALGAYRQAVARGSEPGGELQVVGFLPLPVVAVTVFWLVGGSLGAPATTLGRYVSAWENNDPAAAAGLFATPMSPADIEAMWVDQTAYLEQQVTAAFIEYGPLSGIDPDEPFNSLRFTEAPSTSGDTATVAVELVRRQRVESLLLGFIPTATQETVVVEQLGTIDLAALPDTPPAWLAGVKTGASVWLIDTIALTTGVVDPQAVLSVDTIVDNAIVKD